MKVLQINIAHLKKGVHEYAYELEDSFLKEFKGSVIDHGSGKGKVVLEISATFIKASFIFEGIVELICDRSLALFDEQIRIEDYLIFKFADRDEEVDERVMLINEQTQVLDLNKYLFEFIMLQIPMKKIHPSLREDDFEDEGEMYFVYGTDRNNKEEQQKSGSSDGKTGDSNSEEPVDPRFAALKQLKKK